MGCFITQAFLHLGLVLTRLFEFVLMCQTGLALLLGCWGLTGGMRHRVGYFCALALVLEQGLLMLGPAFLIGRLGLEHAVLFSLLGFKATLLRQGVAAVLCLDRAFKVLQGQQLLFERALALEVLGLCVELTARHAKAQRALGHLLSKLRLNLFHLGFDRIFLMVNFLEHERAFTF